VSKKTFVRLTLNEEAMRPGLVASVSQENKTHLVLNIVHPNTKAVVYTEKEPITSDVLDQSKALCLRGRKLIKENFSHIVTKIEKPKSIKKGKGKISV